MGNFKTGDVVLAKYDYCGTCGGQKIIKGKEYTILSVSDDGTYYRVMTELGVIDGFTAQCWKLVGDDPLPPAPESVRYYHRGYHGIHADAYLDVHSGHFASGPRIRINDKENRGITIDADTALQLAHDLTRMAMGIKRKEKQNG